MAEEPLEIKKKEVMRHIPLLYSDSWFDRYKAAKRIGDYAEYDNNNKGLYAPAVEPLSKLLGDSDSEVRAAAARTLAFCADGSVGEELLKLVKDPSITVRYNTIFSLGELRVKQAKPALKQILKSTEEQVQIRGVAAWALAKINGEDDLKELESVWDDESQPGAVRLDCKKAAEEARERKKTSFGKPL